MGHAHVRASTRSLLAASRRRTSVDLRASSGCVPAVDGVGRLHIARLLACEGVSPLSVQELLQLFQLLFAASCWRDLRIRTFVCVCV